MSIELETLALAKAYTDKHVGRPTDEQTAEAVSNYLDQHPVQPYDDTEIKGEVASVKADLTKVATVDRVSIIDFLIGVWAWSTTDNDYVLQENSQRITADLRHLNLTQGDTVGITDYTTYSMAFGDNSTGWYGGGYATHDVTANDTSINPYIVLIKRNDGANMTNSDLLAIKSQFHTSSSSQYEDRVIFSPSSMDYIRKNLHHTNNNYAHFSFDDTSICIQNLANSNYMSIWNEPFLNMLKELHDNYGVVFSLYVWDINTFSQIDEKYKPEFVECSDWLKFGFHAVDQGSMESATAEQATTAYNMFINTIYRICGTNSIDRVPRLNYFAGNVNALNALKNANCGCIGFLNADNSRNSYYLNSAQLAYSRTHSLLSDINNGLQFVSTVLRLDWFVSGYSSQYTYNVPVYNNVYDELVYRYNQPSMCDLYSALIVFTHEWQIYNTSHEIDLAMKNRIVDFCRFVNNYEYDFDYPQNRISDIRSYTVE